MIRFGISAEERAVRAFRFYSYVYIHISKILGYFFYQHYKIKFGCDIAPTARIGKNFRIAHIGGIVIGRNVVIGNGCTINNCVTLGMKSSDEPMMPIVGENVYISTGAKLLGNIKIGDNCIIGANSVVIKSFDDSCLIAGAPAIEKKRYA